MNEVIQECVCVCVIHFNPPLCVPKTETKSENEEKEKVLGWNS